MYHMIHLDHLIDTNNKLYDITTNSEIYIDL